MASGSLLKQIVLTGVQGFELSVSALQTVTATTGDANTVITDVGLLWVQPTPASVSLQMQSPADTWTQVVAASTTNATLVPSDGTNLRVHSADTSTNRSATYFIIQ